MKTVLFVLCFGWELCSAWIGGFVGRIVFTRRTRQSTLYGWLDNFLPKADNNFSEKSRKAEFPEQYPATYERSNVLVDSDGPEAKIVRPLLKQTMMETRPLQVVYDSKQHGWTPRAFHERVDGKGAAVVLCTCSSSLLVGGYNPKGWASMGGARPSVAAFLFTLSPQLQKFPKVGGGGLACARDDPTFGISFGPDGLVIALQPGPRQRLATSKLGTYFERGSNGKTSLFDGGATQLDRVQVLVGVYQPGEEIPYSGAVFDMTSG
mmetsp:Transcript_15910/g.36569  ORF Transcript_15910/g.36569 Transcript_15910/m.36569 type:complete len:264 (+) Transcript_15910:135-926(+)|eukprot:CAMPEP_0116825424 /NCGR_PEP_ID=MMETSP0418-20121206/1956_1 /TAXON_ID=1158023 /ORGANISM="Astrosyne radiata, Strain 13vi08-1A" /LENGTH=263 /DNA_ID=CAMNT_0004453927 /DNA_START=229 /DNA_END=1020 /DNA_ORIENTATION=+